jgi:hypothetical protein
VNDNGGAHVHGAVEVYVYVYVYVYGSASAVRYLHGSLSRAA